MANFRRKRCRKQVRCTLCTPYRHLGNTGARFKERETLERKRIDREKREGAYVDL
jgi:hypothetical protein